ncbi:MAG: acetylxylan esterase [Verrucomicrobia bacterium]|nr:acetylxylan esterase [Verrucomicrobiota bacterium]
MTLRTPHRSFSRPLAALLLFLSPALFAQAASSTNYQINVGTDRPEAIYEQNETVGFNLTVTLNGQFLTNAEVQWTMTKDGVPPVRTGTIFLTSGHGTVTGTLAEPGFLQFRATFHPPASRAPTAVAGAGIDPLKIKPSLPVPDDFDEFWSAQKKKLAAVRVNPRLTSVKSPHAEVECFDLKADSHGSPVSGYFARPAEAKPKSLPIILTVHGAGVRSSSLDGPANWAKQGFLALDINAHGIPNGQPQSYYSELANGALKDYRSAGRESRETVYFLGMFLRVLRAIDFLTEQPEWDGRTVIVYGSSQGGAQAIVAAGLDERVTFFAAGVPAMCDHTGTVAGRVNGWPKLVPSGLDGTPNPQVLQVARYYDMVNFATRAKAAGIVTVGFIDATCPPSTVYAAYNALPGMKEMFNDPTATHTISAHAGAAMRQAILRHAGK